MSQTRESKMIAPTRDAHTNWTVNNPILPEGVFAITKGRLHAESVEYFIGDGTHTYNELAKFGCFKDASGKIPAVDLPLTDSLTEDNSNAVLSARAGKQLRDMITNLEGGETDIRGTIATLQSDLDAKTTNVNAVTLAGQAPDHYRCTNGCSWTCSAGCTGGCLNGCTGGCLAGCTGGCSSCTGSCTGSCSTTCTGGCTGCTGTCSGGCSGCSGTCTGSCTSCTGSCSGSCSTTCTGTCSAACRDACSNGCGDGCDKRG